MKVIVQFLLFSLFSLSVAAQAGIEVVSEVDQPPRFPSCEDLSDGKMKSMCAEKKMYKFIYKRLDYPEDARKNNLEDIVVVQIEVGISGRVKILKVVNECNPELAEAALETVEHMPDWIPAQKSGKAVGSVLNIPIAFEL